MGEIDFTNIIVDDFRKGKFNPFSHYIYFLTHIHSDHLRGLSNSWDYGPIYCSQITANLILNKFPKLAGCINVLKLEEQYQLTLAQNISVTVTLFDANHCAGSVIILFQGYLGRILYTGDFRFDQKKFSTYTYLYPPEKCNPNFQGCSRKIDKMWLDNTFCNPRFNFMTQNEALQIVLNFVKQHEDKKIYVGMDYYGKQQVLIHVAKQLDLIIAVDEQRYENIIAMQFDRQLFTTNPQQSRIQVVFKPKLHDKLLENPQAIGLVMSGWSLSSQWRCVRGTKQKRIYYVPYSLHSNYKQIVGFVKSVKPSLIQPVVSIDSDNCQGNISTDNLYNTQGNEQAFNQMIEKYTSPVSAEFDKNLADKQFQQNIREKLGLNKKQSQINKMYLSMGTTYMPARGKGYRLSNERNQQQINKVKQQLKKRYQKNKKAPQPIVINEQNSSEVEIVKEIQIIDESDECQQVQQVQQIDKQQNIVENQQVMGQGKNDDNHEQRAMQQQNIKLHEKQQEQKLLQYQEKVIQRQPSKQIQLQKSNKVQGVQNQNKMSEIIQNNKQKEIGNQHENKNDGNQSEGNQKKQELDKGQYNPEQVMNYMKSIVLLTGKQKIRLDLKIRARQFFMKLI